MEGNASINFSPEDDQEDDPIIKEIPVFLVQTLAPKLSLWQFPLRKPWKQYPSIQEVRIKPNQYKFEVDYEDTKTEENSDPNSDISGHVHRLVSTQIPRRTNYVIGIVDIEGQQASLHLTPLKHIIQFRPSFFYMDEGEKNSKMDAMEEEKAEEEEMEEELVPLQVQYKKQESVRSQLIKQRVEKKRQEQEEPWVKLLVLPADHFSSQHYDLFSSTSASVSSSVTFLNKAQYLHSICPVPVSKKTLSSLHDPLEKTELDEVKSLNEQVKALMLNANILQFKRVCDLLPKSIPPKQIIKALESCSVLLHGCWIVKSKFVFPHQLEMEAIRDFLLTKFFYESAVSRKSFSEETKVSNATSRDLLSSIAVLNIKQRIWTLKYPPDDEFLFTNFPEVVESWLKFWKGKPSDFRSFLEELKELKATSEKASTPVSSSEPVIRRRISLPQLDESLPIQTLLECYLREMLKLHTVLNMTGFLRGIEEYKKINRFLKKKKKNFRSESHFF